MSVFVTGGSGVVGSALLTRLVSKGYETFAMARSPEASSTVEQLGAKAIRGDILDFDETVLEGIDVVYHVAGVNELCPRDPDSMRLVNVEGTRNVVQAAHRAGVRRLVYTSSVAVLGHRAVGLTDESLIHSGRFVSHYAATKWEAEKVAFSEVGSCEVVAVNPASVQGPGRATGTAKIILDLAADKLPVLTDTSISIVDVNDCAQGHILAAERGVPGERYILSGFTVTIPEALALLTELTGRVSKTRLVPAWALRPLGPMVGLTARRFGFSLGGLELCREILDNLLIRHTYDGSKASRELGLEYRSAASTLGALLTWAESEGHYVPKAG